MENNFVIFRHFSLRGYWEVSGRLYTTYLMDEMITSDNKTGLRLMLDLHEIHNNRELEKDLEKFTNDPQEDMFIVELNN